MGGFRDGARCAFYGMAKAIPSSPRCKVDLVPQLDACDPHVDSSTTYTTGTSSGYKCDQQLLRCRHVIRFRNGMIVTEFCESNESCSVIRQCCWFYKAGNDKAAACNNIVRKELRIYFGVIDAIRCKPGNEMVGCKRFGT